MQVGSASESREGRRPRRCLLSRTVGSYLGGSHVGTVPVPADLVAPSGRLGTAAMTAVERLAASAGHPVAPLSVVAPDNTGTTEFMPGRVLGIGTVLITAAWAVSARMRPFGFRDP